jgi:tetratricopeptide (TPR) repeat protein
MLGDRSPAPVASAVAAGFRAAALKRNGRRRLAAAGGGAAAACFAALIGLGVERAAAAGPSPDPSRTVPPRAAGPRLASLEAERQRLFAEMMRDPSNLDLAFRYASLSSQAGDLEGAVATLERMLIFAPGLPRLQLELGVLYYRLGAYDTASTYFSGALAAPDVPDEVRRRVESYQTAIAERNRTDSFTGFVAAGVRYQTNANAAPENRLIRTTLLADPLLLDEGSLGQDDVNGYVSSTIHYSHDLAAQGDKLEANLQTYGALYADQHEINTAFAELTAGPTFNLERFSMENTTLGLYGILGGLVLEKDPYLVSGGAGAALAHDFGLLTRATLGAEYRREAFQDSDLRPTASDRTGDRYRLFGGVQHQLNSRLTLFAGLNGERRDADSDFLSYYEGGVSAGARLSFRSPFASQEAPWVFGLTGGYIKRDYDDPDRLFSFTEEERDDESFVEGSLTVPVAADWAVQTTVGYRNISSNYDLRNYDNVSTSLGIVWRF